MFSLKDMLFVNKHGHQVNDMLTHCQTSLPTFDHMGITCRQWHGRQLGRASVVTSGPQCKIFYICGVVIWQHLCEISSEGSRLSLASAADVVVLGN